MLWWQAWPWLIVVSPRYRPMKKSFSAQASSWMVGRPSQGCLHSESFLSNSFRRCRSKQSFLRKQATSQVSDIGPADEFTGPIPYMLEDAVQWVALNSSRAAAADSTGHLRDVPAWPPESVRETIANALVHRDLGPWATSQPITIRLEPDTLTVTNPGGLYGLTVQRLQPDDVESFARNSALLQICQYARLPDGRRVVEGLATGIPKMFQALNEAASNPRSFLITPSDSPANSVPDPRNHPPLSDRPPPPKARPRSRYCASFAPGPRPPPHWPKRPAHQFRPSAL